MATIIVGKTDFNGVKMVDWNRDELVPFPEALAGITGPFEVLSVENRPGKYRDLRHHQMVEVKMKRDGKEMTTKFAGCFFVPA